MPKKTVSPAIPPDFNRTALLIIDVQLGLFQKATPIYEADQLLHNINLLIERARVGGVPIIYIQHSDPRNLVKDTPGWRLHPRLHPPEHDPVVHKLHGNAFEETELAGLLAERRVGRLVVSGLVTHGCVRATCLGGRELGYPVTLVSDAHSSYSPDAAALIMKWHDNLAQAGVLLQPTAEIHFDHQPVEASFAG